MPNQNEFNPMTTKRYLHKYIACLINQKWILDRETYDMHKSFKHYINREHIKIFNSRKDIENYLTALIDKLIDEYNLQDISFYSNQLQYCIFHYCNDEYNIR